MAIKMSLLLLLWDKFRNIPSQPCCGYFLHGGTRLVGILDFFFSLFAIILISSELYQNFQKLPMFYLRQEYFKYYVKTASWAGYFTFEFFIMGLSILLFRAAKKRSSRLCKLWMVLSTVANCLFVTTFYINHYIFTIAIIFTFIKEIECYGGFNAALSGLTDAEVEEFEKGFPPDRDQNDPCLAVQTMAFNKDFEILPENLELDEDNLLGSGAFGCVYRAKLTTESGEVKCVAVKTVSQSADVMYFKTLLSELKVMTFVGHHENVVGLIGASTAHIKRKTLYMIVEFCPFGNLYEFLKARRGLFVNLVKDGQIRSDFGTSGHFGYSNIKPGNTITTLDIFKWIWEACAGLEHLEEKKVIHGDIATRNILLGYGKVAKISDFGLSKKLYQYTSVVKAEALLPWRWMAIESLSDMVFSTKSDVWSFGVAIWEAFSLSEVPFPGFSWDTNFITNINGGLRMSQPRNATNELYTLMLKCWQPDPVDRPTFREVNAELSTMLSNARLVIDSCNKEDNRPTSNSHCDDDDIEIYIPNHRIVDSIDPQ